MARSLNTELVRAMNGTETDIPLAAFLRVKHPSITTLQVVNYPEEVRRTTDGLWLPFPFSVTLPALGDDQVPVLNVSVANVSLELTEIARRIAGTAILATAAILILNTRTPNNAGISFLDYDIQNILYDTYTFSFELRLYTSLDRELARYRFSPTVAEGLF